MEKIFTPNRWFVMFCALLIVVWGALKYVGDMRLAEHAQLIAQKNIFEWRWPALNTNATVRSLKAHVVRRDGTDAVVEVTGRQLISTAGGAPKISDCKAVLTFYRLQDQWRLGRVELE